MLWYVIYATHQAFVEKRLATIGVETFVPKRIVWRKFRRKPRERREIPLVPGYLFVRTEHQRVRRILDIPHVCFFLGFGAPRAVAESVIGSIQARLEAGEWDEAKGEVAGLFLGDSVIVPVGPWVTFPGKIVGLGPAGAEIEVYLFGRPTKTIIPLDRFKSHGQH